MRIAVRYSSRSGRTEGIAKAIANELNVEAKSVNHKLDESVDILFIGCGLYGKINSNVKKFLRDNKMEVKKVVTFTTSALVEDLHPRLKNLVSREGYQVDGRHFHCPGTLGLKHIGRPNTQDEANARKFVKDFLLNQ